MKHLIICLATLISLGDYWGATCRFDVNVMRQGPGGPGDTYAGEFGVYNEKES